MTRETDIATAIARSVSHTEIVEVEVTDIDEALTEVNCHCADYDHTDCNEGEAVWGTTEACSEFRLLLRKA